MLKLSSSPSHSSIFGNLPRSGSACSLQAGQSFAQSGTARPWLLHLPRHDVGHRERSPREHHHPIFRMENEGTGLIHGQQAASPPRSPVASLCQAPPVPTTSPVVPPQPGRRWLTRVGLRSRCLLEPAGVIQSGARCNHGTSAQLPRSTPRSGSAGNMAGTRQGAASGIPRPPHAQKILPRHLNTANTAVMLSSWHTAPCSQGQRGQGAAGCLQEVPNRWKLLLGLTFGGLASEH